MAQPQQQNFQQTDNYYDPTAGYENTTAGTADAAGQQPPADAAGYPSADAAGYPSADAAGYPSTDAAGYPSTDAAGYPSTDAAGYPSADAAGYRPTDPVVDVSSTGYIPGEYGTEDTAVPGWTQETGEPGAEIPPEADVNPEEQADPGETPPDTDGASVSAAGTGQTPPPEEPPTEGGLNEVSPLPIEAKEGTESRRNSKNYSTKYGGRSDSRRRHRGQVGSGDYYKSSKSQTYPTKSSATPHVQQQQQQQQQLPYQSPCQIGVIPMRSAAFQAPRIPLPKLCQHLLPDEGDEGQEDEDGVAFQFKPQTHCRTEVTFTIEPKPQPPWLTMLNCGFKPMVNCSAPPCYLSPSGNPGMDYMGGNQTVVNRTFGSQVQYCGMANFPTLQQIQNSFPGGKIIDASRKDKKGKAVSGSESSSESSSEDSSSSGSESEEEESHHQYYQHRHPYHYHQTPAHHQHHPQQPHHHQYAHAHHIQQHHLEQAQKHQQQHHQNAQAQRHQQQKQEVELQRRKSTYRKSRIPSQDLPRKSVFTERKTRGTLHDVHDHKHRHSRHSHHHHSKESSKRTDSDLSRSSDWHL